MTSETHTPWEGLLDAITERVRRAERFDDLLLNLKMAQDHIDGKAHPYVKSDIQEAINRAEGRS